MSEFKVVDEEVFQLDSEFRLPTPQILKAIEERTELNLRVRLGINRNYTLKGHLNYFRDVYREIPAEYPCMTEGYFETAVQIRNMKYIDTSKLELGVEFDEEAANEANVPLRGLMALLAGNKRKLSVWLGGSIDGLEILSKRRPDERAISPRRAASAYFLKSIDEILGSDPVINTDEPEPVLS